MINLEQQPPAENPELELLRRVEQHIETNTVPANDAVRTCVDGGYAASPEVDGSIAFPGADLGTAQALLALGYTPKHAVDKVAAFVKSKGQKFYWHTDQHEGSKGCVIGCGHCNAAITESDDSRYGVTPSSAEEMIKYVRGQQAQNPDLFELVTLDREHQEEAILVVSSSTYSVRPWDVEQRSMFFVYDKVRHEKYLQEFTDFLDDENITLENLVKAASEQMDSTLGLLGTSKGASIFEVTMDDGENLKATFAGNAPNYT